MDGIPNLTVSEIFEAFPSELPTVQRELRRLNKEVKVYEKFVHEIEAVDDELSRLFLMKVLEIIYMRHDKRFDQITKLKALQRMMRHDKKGISDADIDRAREYPYEDLHSFHKLRKTRTGFTACCPFHEDKNASFSVRNKKWICFAGCGRGDIFDFVKKQHGYSFLDAVEYLRARQ